MRAACPVLIALDILILTMCGVEWALQQSLPDLFRIQRGYETGDV
jgi:hypothetical protein